MDRREALRVLGLGTASVIGTAGAFAGCVPPPPPDEPWETVFFDGFNGNSLDLSVWEVAHPLFNYGDAGGQNLDSVSLPERASVHDGALHLEVVKQDWDTRQVSATATPQIAHYQGVQVDSREPILAPGQRVLFGVATDLNFRPAFWTSAPQAGDDGELDFEFFSNNDSLTYTQIWDYSPFTQHQLNVPTTTLPNPANVHEYGIYRRLDGVIIWTIDGVEQFRSPQRMSNNPHRVRLTHCVGGRWDGGYRSDTGSGGSLDPAVRAMAQVRWVVVQRPV